MDDHATVDAAAVRDRASIEHYEPPVGGIENPLWIAEDPETGHQGVGHVQEEAVGNLVAVVAERGEEPTAYAKLPGQTVERFDEKIGDRTGLLDRLRNLL